MAESHVRLTIIGRKTTIQRFVNDEAWQKTLGVRYLDWLELFPGRHVCEFDSRKAMTQAITAVSRSWPKLTLLVDVEIQRQQIKVLLVAKAGRIESSAINY